MQVNNSSGQSEATDPSKDPNLTSKFGNKPIAELDPCDLFERLKTEKLSLIDVREWDEFTSNHIEGSTFHPLSKFNPLEIEHTAPVVFICRSGKRSKRAAGMFLFHFPQAKAYNLHGGLLAWDSASLPLVQS